MPINYPKFNNKIQNQIDSSKMKQSKSRPGLIMGFDRKTNLATVILDDPLSGQIGNIINGVPCPSVMGIQSVAPEPGTRCLIGFRDDNENYAYIISYFNEPSKRSGNMHDYVVNTGVPKFMAR